MKSVIFAMEIAPKLALREILAGYDLKELTIKALKNFLDHIKELKSPYPCMRCPGYFFETLLSKEDVAKLNKVFYDEYGNCAFEVSLCPFCTLCTEFMDTHFYSSWAFRNRKLYPYNMLKSIIIKCPCAAYKEESFTILEEKLAEVP